MYRSTRGRKRMKRTRDIVLDKLLFRITSKLVKSTLFYVITRCLLVFRALSSKKEKAEFQVLSIKETT